MFEDIYEREECLQFKITPDNPIIILKIKYVFKIVLESKK